MHPVLTSTELPDSPFSVMDSRHIRRRLSIGDTCIAVVHEQAASPCLAPQRGSYLPVNVLLNEAGALPDVKTLQ